MRLEGFRVTPFAIKAFGQSKVSKRKIRIHFDCFAEILDRSVVLFRVEVRTTQFGSDDNRKGVELSRLFHFRNSFLIPAKNRQVDRVPLMAGGIVGIQLKTALKLRISLFAPSMPYPYVGK